MGGDLRQPMAVGRIIDWALRIYRAHFPAFFLIACVTVPLNLLSGVLPGTLFASSNSPGQDARDALVLAALFVPQAFVNYLATAAIATSVADVDREIAPDFGRAYDVVFSRLGALLAAGLRVFVPFLLLSATIVGIPVAIWLLIRWSFVEQVVMIEGARGRDAPARSAHLVAGSWWRVLGIWLMLGLLGVVPQVIISPAASLSPVLVSALATAAVAALALPFVAIGQTLLYFDLTARKEADVTPS